MAHWFYLYPFGVNMDLLCVQYLEGHQRAAFLLLFFFFLSVSLILLLISFLFLRLHAYSTARPGQRWRL